ncbi:hypothetical protein BJ742DRAFT_869906 [Cladochytrium replicatum]|nr:hypothetical protein BJ742DRAFT_869906 [Cladochytrium replicatum]
MQQTTTDKPGPGQTLTHTINLQSADSMYINETTEHPTPAIRRPDDVELSSTKSLVERKPLAYVGNLRSVHVPAQEPRRRRAIHRFKQNLRKEQESWLTLVGEINSLKDGKIQINGKVAEDGGGCQEEGDDYRREEWPRRTKRPTRSTKAKGVPTRSWVTNQNKYKQQANEKPKRFNHTLEWSTDVSKFKCNPDSTVRFPDEMLAQRIPE